MSGQIKKKIYRK